MTLSLRSTFALILSVLALACAERAERGGRAVGREVRAWQLPVERGADPVDQAEEAPAPRFRRGGSPLLDGPPPRLGAPPPRGAPGTDRSPFLSFAARAADRRATGARTRRILTLSLARRHAAARDGTLSSRSNGVPPPVHA